jgi:3-deoxy-D-manno-octulosonic-acid transferase
MDNFQPLARHLLDRGGALPAHDEASVALAVRAALDPPCAADLTDKAMRVLSSHQGATRRHLSVLHQARPSA